LALTWKLPLAVAVRHWPPEVPDTRLSTNEGLLVPLFEKPENPVHEAEVPGVVVAAKPPELGTPGAISALVPAAHTPSQLTVVVAPPLAV
jgi:hypothetical protein